MSMVKCVSSIIFSDIQERFDNFLKIVKSYIAQWITYMNFIFMNFIDILLLLINPVSPENFLLRHDNQFIQSGNSFFPQA